MRSRVLLPLLALVLLVPACGNDDAADPHANHGHVGASPGTKADHTYPVVAKDFKFEGLDGLHAEPGEAIEFVLTNSGQAEHELRITGADGVVVGATEHVKAGATARTTVEFTSAGTYTYVCTIGGHDSIGMKGTFTVA